jgi:hypothetical protein
MIDWEKILPEKRITMLREGIERHINTGYNQAIDDCLSALKSPEVSLPRENKKRLLPRFFFKNIRFAPGSSFAEANILDGSMEKNKDIRFTAEEIVLLRNYQNSELENIKQSLKEIPKCPKCGSCGEPNKAWYWCNNCNKGYYDKPELRTLKELPKEECPACGKSGTRVDFGKETCVWCGKELPKQRECPEICSNKSCVNYSYYSNDCMKTHDWVIRLCPIYKQWKVVGTCQAQEKGE